VTISREDVELLLRLDEVHGPSREAKQFIWSDVLERVVSAGTFFDSYTLDSDERFHVNEIATYYEMAGLLWHSGVVSQEAVFEWVPAAMYWARLGPVLTQAREVFGAESLWEHFEALATAQSSG